ncbi:MAG: HPr-rel-A system PqqD family peptide chaperone [Candidatus Competibacteraceae bacterium]
MRWRRNYYYKPQWCCWDTEQYIVFNSGSAQTHHLNQFAADILMLLKTQPLTLPELTERLIGLYEDIEIDDEIASYLHEVLALLDSIGLIEPEMM